MSTADLLIVPRWLLPMAPSAVAFEGQAVAVSAGRIAAIGPVAELEARFDDGGASFPHESRIAARVRERTYARSDERDAQPAGVSAGAALDARNRVARRAS